MEMDRSQSYGIAYVNLNSKKKHHMPEEHAVGFEL